MKKPLGQLALEEFLNDTVTQIRGSIYQWRDKHYQSMTIKAAKTQGYRMDHFIKVQKGMKTYVIREISDKLYKLLVVDK